MKVLTKKIMFVTACLALMGCRNGQNSSSDPSSFDSSKSNSSSEEGADMKNFPNYVEDVDSLSYSFSKKELREPFYWGNVIYNESALMVKGKDGTISCQLRFKPKRVISIHDYTWTKEYVEGRDYKVEGNKISLLEGSAISYWSEDQLRGIGIPSPYVGKSAITDVLHDYVVWTGVSVYTESPFFYGNQIHVTYAYDIKDLDLKSYPSYSLDKLPKLKSKLLNKEDVKIVTIGDSVSEGCSSSATFHHEPNMDPWVPQVAEELGAFYGSKITSVNQSVGGTTAGYVSTDPSKLQAIKDEKPDLVFIHYGINDLGNSETPNTYHDLILDIVLYIQDEAPNAEIVLVSPIAPNPFIYDDERMGMYEEKLNQIANDYGSKGKAIACINVNKASKDYFKTGIKRYEDYTANGINHPNDFGHRFYMHCVLGALIDPTKVHKI